MAPWQAAGFESDGQTVRVSRVAIELQGARAGRGLTGWTLSGADRSPLDGLPTRRADPVHEEPAGPHPNGVAALDHVVAFSPDLGRTVAALESAGLDLRRLREGPTAAGARRQAFFRVGEPLLEVIEHPPETAAAADLAAAARFWGLAFVCDDLDSTARLLGDRLGEVRAAIQPGRRIATFRREAALGLPVALMSR